MPVQIKGSSFSWTFYASGYSQTLQDPEAQHEEAPDKTVVTKVSGPGVMIVHLIGAVCRQVFCKCFCLLSSVSTVCQYSVSAGVFMSVCMLYLLSVGVLFLFAESLNVFKLYILYIYISHCKM